MAAAVAAAEPVDEQVSSAMAAWAVDAASPLDAGAARDDSSNDAVRDFPPAPAECDDDQRAFYGSFTVDVAAALGPGASATHRNVKTILSADISAAAATLAAGNRDDPMIVALGAEGTAPDVRLTSLRWLYDVMLQASVPPVHGAVCLRTPGDEAAAIWFPKGRDLDVAALAAAGGWQYVWKFSSWSRRARFPEWGQYMRAARSRLYHRHERNYWYLLTCAVRPDLPEEERKAHLAAVIRPVQQRAAVQGCPCAVEATTPWLRDLLISLGFKELETVEMFGVKAYLMFAGRRHE